MKMNKMKKVTLKDVAEKVGVSTAAVSQALTNSSSNILVSEKTREKILDVVKELNYSPNVYARSLRTQRTYIIGVVIANIESGHFGPIIGGIEEVVIPREYQFLITDAHGIAGREVACVNYFLSRQVEGIIFVGAPKDCSDKVVRKVMEERIPCATIERDSRICPPSVVINNESGGYLAAKYLLELGHRRVAFLSGPPNRVDCQDRLKGYKRALKEFGVDFKDFMIGKEIMGKREKYTQGCGYDIMKALLRQYPEATACFCYNDLSAIGAMKALKDEGRKIPEDFSIVGFDDAVFAQYVDPPLTTICQPTRELGRKTATFLLEVLSGGDRKAAERIVLEPELIIRETVKENKKTPA